MLSYTSELLLYNHNCLKIGLKKYFNLPQNDYIFSSFLVTNLLHDFLVTNLRNSSGS